MGSGGTKASSMPPPQPAPASLVLNNIGKPVPPAFFLNQGRNSCKYDECRSYLQSQCNGEIPRWSVFSKMLYLHIYIFHKCCRIKASTLANNKITPTAVSFSWSGYVTPGHGRGRNCLRDAHLRLLHGCDDASAPSPLQASLVHVLLLKYLLSSMPYALRQVNEFEL